MKLKVTTIGAAILFSGCANEVVVEGDPAERAPVPFTGAVGEGDDNGGGDDVVTPEPDPLTGEGEGDASEGEGDGGADVPPPPPPPAPCSYPSTAGGFARTGDVMPAFVWQNARNPDGSPASLDLADFHCDHDDGFNGAVFLLSAGWCGNCPGYMRDLAPDVDALEAAGLRVVLVLMEDDAGNSATADDADAYADHYFDGAVLRVGDGDTRPTGALYSSPIWTAFPGALVVRKSDMVVVANQEDQGQTLDFFGLAEDMNGGDL